MKLENPQSGYPTGNMGQSVGVDGDTMIVGAPQTDPSALRDTGTARVYVSDGLGGWSLQAELIAPDAAAGDRFGWSVSVSGDTAYVFARSRGVWTQKHKLIAADVAGGAGSASPSPLMENRSWSALPTATTRKATRARPTSSIWPQRINRPT